MRESGILMHLTSLPEPYGIGTMGREAYRFIDFLYSAGQKNWQVLPLNPTGCGDSPYQSFGTCAGNHYLIDLDFLVNDGLLKKEEIEARFWGKDPGRVDFSAMYRNRPKILRLAYNRFRPTEAFQKFVEENALWLADYTLFMALKWKFGGLPWLEWPEELRQHDQTAIAEACRELTDEIRMHTFLQFKFCEQWHALRAYAHEKGINIIGDVPIYVPLDSADVWAEPELFQLDENRHPIKVAGCPPDAFTANGQLWGNPLYDWEKMAENGYRWWIDRLEAAAKMYDVVRLDHFRGFESYWSVDAGEDTARNGVWEKGPGLPFIQAVKNALPELKFIAEDLGYVTKEVRQLQLDSGFPGMKVMEFAFDSREKSNYLPHLYPVDSVCYTGTHDNVPLRQWFDEAAPGDVSCAKSYLGLNQEEGYVQGMIRGAMSSVSKLCIVQMQDYLGLGREARMNYPGTMSSSNWTWRAESGFDSEELAKEIHRITKLYGRVR